MLVVQIGSLLNPNSSGMSAHAFEITSKHSEVTQDIWFPQLIAWVLWFERDIFA